MPNAENGSSAGTSSRNREIRDSLWPPISTTKSNTTACGSIRSTTSSWSSTTKTTKKSSVLPRPACNRSTKPKHFIKFNTSPLFSWGFFVNFIYFCIRNTLKLFRMAILRFRALDEMSRREPVKTNLPARKKYRKFSAPTFSTEKRETIHLKRSLRKLVYRYRRGKTYRPENRQSGRPRHENLGHGERCNALFALVPTAQRLDSRKTRRFLRTHVRWRFVRNVQGRTSRPTGTRCLKLP